MDPSPFMAFRRVLYLGICFLLCTHWTFFVLPLITISAYMAMRMICSYTIIQFLATRFVRCVEDIQQMTENRLRLNASKTEMMWIGLAKSLADSVFSCHNLKSYNRRTSQVDDPSDLVVPRSRTVGFGSRMFAVLGPTFWNSLTNELKNPSLTEPAFKKQLKTFLFRTV